MNDVNEDSLCMESLADGTALFAVADGIGGYEGGEVASALAVATLVEVAARAEGDLAARLGAAVAEANRRILASQQEGPPGLQAMGTTLTALAIAPSGEAAVVHIGDSRLYRLSPTGLRALTEDHNVGTELVREGLLDAAELAHHPQRHMLTRALGVADEPSPDAFSLEVGSGDAFVLVTDGMVDALGDAEIARLAAEHAQGSWDDLGPTMAARAAEHRNSDDATIVAVALVADPAPEVER